ncbi:endonuclease VII domain-containing protein [Segniliparus rugosus]|nr:endonuclease VII domain-containing protein [Segniliparus rugosus]
MRRCVDCVSEGIVTRRKTKPPGPRCATHARARRAGRRDTSWEARILATYGITAEEYWRIYESQGGVCYICRRATGARKRLSVDHCHKTGRVRGLLCQKDNRDVLGHLRDDPEALRRAVEYLESPPAQRVVGERVVPGFASAE